MNGAESLVKTLLRGKVDTCFANPGTSEMHFVAALDKIPGIKCVLGLHENVVTGMADGYFRVARKPAATLLHCGPGLANGLSNLHNARRANSAIINIVGDHASFHRKFDAPLTADTVAMANTVSHWVRTSNQVENVGRDAASAIQASKQYPGQIATLILPSDCSWNIGGAVSETNESRKPEKIDRNTVIECAKALNSSERVLILLSGEAVSKEGQSILAGIKNATNVDLMIDFSAATVSRGRGCLPLARIPYNTGIARKKLSIYETIILVGAKPPVGFFAYPNQSSLQANVSTRFINLANYDQNLVEALNLLAEELNIVTSKISVCSGATELPTGKITPEGLAQTLAILMPENAIVSDESVSYGRGFYEHTYSAASHEWLHLVGGSIGDGLPVATGAAIASKRSRRVISLQADGAAMYSLQSLWTQARENLPCTTIILSNRKYQILMAEYKNVGASPGQTAFDMMDLGNPDIDWIKLANGMGVEAQKVSTFERLSDVLHYSFDTPSPFLIELEI